MEINIVLFGIVLPVVLGAACITWWGSSTHARGGDFFWGPALSITVFVSALSQDSLVNFTSQNKWLWFACSVLLCGLLVGAGIFLTRPTTTRSFVVCACAILGALLLNIPGWHNILERFLLAVALVPSVFLLLIAVQKRGDFSTPMALSFALIAPSVLAMLSGFAKLSIPIGAASCLLGCASLIQICFSSRTMIHARVGQSGAVVVASIATLGAATGFGYDTNGVSTPSWLLAAIAPLGLWLAEVPLIRTRPTLAICMRILGCVILAAASIVIALRDLYFLGVPIVE